MQQKKFLTSLLAFYFFSGISFALYADEVNNNNNNHAQVCNTAENSGEDTMDVPEPPGVSQQDPYQNYNRCVYRFNKDVDRTFVKPTAIFYKKLLPWPITKAVSNFFTNLSNVPGILNDALQGNLYYTAHDVTRFAINSTIGIGGLVDVASYGGLPQHNNDFGLTLAHWGYNSSSYFIVPFFGPCTVRDTIALPVDYGVFSPYFYLTFWPIAGITTVTQYSVSGLYVIDKRSQYLDFDQMMNDAAIDPYVFERDAYLQHRDALIATNNDINNGTTAKDPYVEDDNKRDTNNNNNNNANNTAENHMNNNKSATQQYQQANNQLQSNQQSSNNSTMQ